MASNILIHREYTNAFPAKLIIEYGQVRTENSNKPHGFGALNPESFTPFPKNPVISRFFRQIGMADELGSGIRKMMRYCKAFGGADPEMIEGDVFRILVKVPEFGKQAPKDILLRPESGAESGAESGVESGVESGMTARVLSMLHQGALSKSAIAKNLGKEKPTRYLNDLMRQLIKKEMVEYTIPDKPKSRLQKYRLTEKGKRFLNEQQAINNN